MKKKLFIISLILSFSQYVIGQKKHYTDISYIKITDTILIKYINKVFEQEVNRNTDHNEFKKGFGYIFVSVAEYPRKDTIIHYSIIPETFYVRKKQLQRFVFPDYYSFVNKILVLVKLHVLRELGPEEYSKKSKIHIMKLVNKHVEKPNPLFDGDTFYSGTSVYVLRKGPPIITIDQ